MTRKINMFRFGSTAALAVLCLAAFIIIGCGGGKEKSLDTPHGVVNSFISRLLDDADLEGAFMLLSESDRAVIKENPEVYNFIRGERNPKTEAYAEAYAQLAPDIFEMVRELVKFNARKGEEKDGYVEVGLEISYPSDYMTIAFSLLPTFSDLQQKYGEVDIESLSGEERDKIIWSVKNDIKKAVASINTDKYSTYIFPVKVIDEGGELKINLGIGRGDGQFDFGN